MNQLTKKFQFNLGDTQGILVIVANSWGEGFQEHV